jgi:hypothetical protein
MKKTTSTKFNGFTEYQKNDLLKERCNNNTIKHIENACKSYIENKEIKKNSPRPAARERNIENAIKHASGLLKCLEDMPEGESFRFFFLLGINHTQLATDEGIARNKSWFKEETLKRFYEARKNSKPLRANVPEDEIQRLIDVLTFWKCEYYHALQEKGLTNFPTKKQSATQHILIQQIAYVLKAINIYPSSADGSSFKKICSTCFDLISNDPQQTHTVRRLAGRE